MKKIISLLCAVLLMCMVVGCSKDNNDKKDTEEPAKKQQEVTSDKDVTLADWDGTWNSIEGYYEDKEVKEALDQVAKADDVDVKTLTDEKLKECHVPWLGLKIEGDKITFLDNFASREGKEIESVKYKFVEMKTVEGEEDEHSHWAVFKAEGDAEHPVLIMMPVHGEDEITHFHIRCGDNAEKLLEMNDWWPVMAKDTSTMDQVVAEVSN